MKKLPFNATTIQFLQTELYALKDNLLAMEATAVSTDFRNWLKSKFEFSPSQYQYLEQMRSDFINYASERISFALINRLPIYFNSPSFHGQEYGAEKIIRGSDKTYFSSDNVAKGSLSFDVSYKLPVLC